MIRKQEQRCNTFFARRKQAVSLVSTEKMHTLLSFQVQPVFTHNTDAVSGTPEL